MQATEVDGRGFGTVFELMPNSDGSSKERVLHSFAAKDGFQPAAGLVLRLSGEPLRHDTLGGPHNGGTIFEL
jgi:hypothetical protein